MRINPMTITSYKSQPLRQVSFGEAEYDVKTTLEEFYLSELKDGKSPSKLAKKVTEDKRFRKQDKINSLCAIIEAQEILSERNK